jgi:hypothetical protein
VWDGFCRVEVVPSPKFHDQLVGDPVEVSVKLTASGAVPDAGAALNEGVGAVGAAVTETSCETGVLEPAALLAVRVAVYVPADAKV